MPGVHRHEVRLSVEHDGPGDVCQHHVDEPLAQSAPTVCGRGHDPTDAVPTGRLCQHPEVRGDLAGRIAQPEVDRARLEVAPVRVEVRALLLDDEHL